MKVFHSLICLAVVLLASCGTIQIGVESTPNLNTEGSPLPAGGAASTPLSQAPTSQTAVTNEAAPTGQAGDAAPQVTPTAQTVQIFLIALEDNGVSGKLVGCGDSAVPVQVQISPTREVLKAALLALLDLKQQNYGESGLYNALYQSDLHLDRVVIEDGEAIIDLSGSLMLGGECDNPRLEAQIVETALQFSTVSRVTVYLNGGTLKDALSLK